MIRIDNVKLPVEHREGDLEKKLVKILKLEKHNIRSDGSGLTYRILRQSIDARKKPEIFYVYSVAAEIKDGVEETVIKRCGNNNVRKYEPLQYELPEFAGETELKGRPVIIGSGPAGLFCAYILCKKGYAPLILERGECVEDRIKSVESFWAGGKLKPDSNVQFGEGGAGTFSDGKLNTGVNDKKGRNQFVLDTFVSFGAPEEIAYKAKPHIGTDILVKVVRKMRDHIIEHGGCFMFDTRMTGIECDTNGIHAVEAEYTGNQKEGSIKKRKDEEFVIPEGDADGRIRIETNCVVLAIGHSARDTFEMLHSRGIDMVQKNFAVGLRLQHPQEMIDRAQYGVKRDGCVSKELPAADYKLVNHTSNGRSVYSFCMCPGGYVVNASSEEGRLAVNGMSYSGRNSLNANSAIIVGVDKEDFGSDDVLAGMEFQRRLEEKAYELGRGRIPVQSYGDYKKCLYEKALKDKADENLPSDMTLVSEEQSGSDLSDLPAVSPQIKGDHEPADLTGLFSDEINSALVESIDKFSYTIQGFDRPDALLAGVESRTSSPVRILRNEELEGSVAGLYPCGEGAGYAGGITSAAMDGIKAAEKIIGKYKPTEGRPEQ